LQNISFQGNCNNSLKKAPTFGARKSAFSGNPGNIPRKWPLLGAKVFGAFGARILDSPNELRPN